MSSLLNLVGRAKAITINPLNPIEGQSDLKAYILKIVDVFLWVAGLLAVIYLIYGGILYITAGGDAEKATKGRTAIVNAVIGIVIVLLALVILNYVKSVLNAR